MSKNQNISSLLITWNKFFFINFP